MDKLKVKIGDSVKFNYAAPALSCHMNGMRVKGEGEVVHVEDNDVWLHVDIGGGRGKRVQRCEVTKIIKATQEAHNG